MEKWVGRGKEKDKQTMEPLTSNLDDYRASVKRLIQNEVRLVIDEEIRSAARELAEEQRKAIREAVDGHKKIIQEVVEEEKLAMRAKVEELKKSIVRLGMG